MSQGKPPLTIRFEYSQYPEVRLQYIHGVWGGVTPQGEIEANFYSESDKLPAYSERILAPDGSLGHEMTPDEEVKRVDRRVHSKLVLNYFTAKAILEWLEEKVEALETENPDNGSFPLDDSGFQQ